MKNPIKFWLKYYYINIYNQIKQEFLPKKTCNIKPMGCKSVFPTENYQDLNISQKFQLIGDMAKNNNLILQK